MIRISSVCAPGLMPPAWARARDKVSGISLRTIPVRFTQPSM
jgi:hypothetical protein